MPDSLQFAKFSPRFHNLSAELAEQVTHDTAEDADIALEHLRSPLGAASPWRSALSTLLMSHIQTQ